MRLLFGSWFLVSGCVSRCCGVSACCFFLVFSGVFCYFTDIVLLFVFVWAVWFFSLLPFVLLAVAWLCSSLL
jgi:hypothetical protein